MRFKTLSAWLNWQENLHPSEIELGLERVSEVAARMRLLQFSTRVITVAGTNGKGSSLAMLDSIYRAAGYRTGLYTSPHIHRYNERIRINGQEVADSQLCLAFEAVDQARADISLSYFEFGTLAALKVFADSDLDIVLLEVGLGGRLDAVNIIDADVTLITAIDIDHVDWLGGDRESIGREKAGVMRPGRVAVVSDPEPPHSVAHHANEIGANLVLAGRDYEFKPGNGSWSWSMGEHNYTSLPVPALPGGFQFQNAAGVLAVIDVLGSDFPVSVEAIADGLRNTRCPGRLTKISHNPEIILDVAHNPQSARSLGEYLEQHPAKGRTVAVLGVMGDKDVTQMLRCLKGQIMEWYLVKPEVTRAMDPQRLGELLAAEGEVFRICGSVSLGIEVARQEAAVDDRIIVFGSFFTVAEAMPETV